MPHGKLLVAAMAFGIMCTSLAADPPVKQTVETPEFRGVEAPVLRGIENKGFPGAVLVVGQPGKVLWAKAYGSHTYEPDSKPMALDTIFDLASLTKVIGTATAAMGLLEDGKLKLDDKVSRYINGFASGGKESVTLKDLMTHVSGLKSYENYKNAESARAPDESTADAMINRIAALPRSYEPRTTVTYSCLNMQTMARVNENAVAGRMDNYLLRKVFAPLGMKDTVYRLTYRQRERTAPTIRRRDGTTNVGVIHDPIAHYYGTDVHCPGNAGLFSTGLDLARYCEMIASGGTVNGKRILEPGTISLMTSLQTPEHLRNRRALGWDIYTTAPYSTTLNQTDETRTIGHTGYTGTLVWIDKLSKTYVVLLTNRTYPDDSRKSSRAVGRARREVCDAVLRALPQYQAYYADKPLKEEEDESD